MLNHEFAIPYCLLINLTRENTYRKYLPRVNKCRKKDYIRLTLSSPHINILDYVTDYGYATSLQTSSPK